ncbi:hypothetical protein [Pseudomonas gessardii]|uniref:Uncharacterized protein n=1 Tax=Pseudomonas gessardii TaxID=78544 RepID=A0A7Y1MVC6_9PSED|nr:hypothetical protein [Pseudomonas gessardii]NNA99051.1 hypothetical protein [Pseudomonas gessardii]
MARQEIILGAAPQGLGGDPPRTASMKINAMTAELYAAKEGLVKVAAIDDFTSGKVLTVGYAGRNGGVAIVKGRGTVLDDLRGAALYACNDTYTGGPPWVWGAIFVENDVHGTGSNGYATQRIWGITNPAINAKRCLVSGTYTPWMQDITTTLATTDPADNPGGLMSLAGIGGFRVAKFANGQICIQGYKVLETVGANTYVAGNWVIPSGLFTTTWCTPTISIAPYVSHDHFGVTTCHMESLTSIQFSVKNGVNAQGFGMWLTVWGYWK